MKYHKKMFIIMQISIILLTIGLILITVLFNKNVKLSILIISSLMIILLSMIANALNITVYLLYKQKYTKKATDK